MLLIFLCLSSPFAMAQMPENLSEEPPETDTLLEEAFQPVYFDFNNDQPQWNLAWRSYYLNRLVDNKPDLLALATGGWLGWHSKLINQHWHVGAALFTSQKIYGPEDKDGTLLLAEGQKSFSGILELYLDYLSPRFNFRLGRMHMETPYMHSSDIRMIPIRFQGVRAIYQLTNNWVFGGSYITHMKDLNTNDYVRLYKLAGVDDDNRGVVTLGTSYRYHPLGKIGVITYYAQDLGSSTYAEFFREWRTGTSRGFEIGLQYSHQQSKGRALAGKFISNHYGIRLKYNLPRVLFSTAYTQMANDSDLFAPWGYSPTFNGGIVEEFTRSGEQALSAGASFELSDFIHGLQLHLYYIYGKTPDHGPHASPSISELDITLEYNFDVAALKGFNLRIRNASVNKHSTAKNGLSNDLNDFRVILNYDYIF